MRSTTLTALIFGALQTVGMAQAQTMSIATNPQGSAYYSAGSAVAGIISQRGDLRLLVQPTSGSSENAALVGSGDVEFAILNTVDAAWAAAGQADFEGHPQPDLRLVGAIFQLPMAIAVPGNSEVQSLEQLAGLRISSGYTSQSTIRYLLDALLEGVGLSMAQMTGLPVANYVQGMEALTESRVDVAIIGPTSGKAIEVNAQLERSGGLRYLPIPDSPEMLAALAQTYPGARVDALGPELNLVGIDKPTNVIALSAFVVVNADVPDDVVYALTKTLAENVEAMRASTSTLALFSAQTMHEPHPVAFHPGALRYYGEQGLLND
jgi:uncharacterized protein